MKPLLPLAVMLVLSGANGDLLAENWPRFRGMTDGVAADHPALPDRRAKRPQVTKRARTAKREQ